MKKWGENEKKDWVKEVGEKKRFPGKPGSRIEDRGSRIEDRGSRIEDRGSRIEDQGSTIDDQVKKKTNKIMKCQERKI